MNDYSYPEVISYLRGIIKGTRWEKHLFVVGGCCRDLVMQRPIHDVDLTVDLPLGSIKFANWLRTKRLTIGEPLIFKRYATARLRLKAFPDDELEIVQTRSDRYGPHNSDNPAAAFGSLTDDCTRRDLTINSLYYNISSGEMLDLCGLAFHDIEHEIIRTPADPERIFADDPLRIMRCIRFSCSLGWDIEQETFDAMHRNPRSVMQASKERIRNEFDKLISCTNPDKALDLMQQCGILKVIMPELEPIVALPDNKSNPGTVWQHTLRTVKAAAAEGADLNLRLAAFFCDAGKAVSYTMRSDGQMAFPGHDRRAASVINPIMQRLRYEPKIINDTIFLARNHTAAKSWGDHAEKMTDADLRKLQYKCENRSRFNMLLNLIHADNISNPLAGDRVMQVENIRKVSDRFRKEHSEMFGYNLPIHSPHIRHTLAIPPGRQVDRCKEFLLNKAFQNPHISRQDCRTLLKFYYSKRTKES